MISSKSPATCGRLKNESARQQLDNHSQDIRQYYGEGNLNLHCIGDDDIASAFIRLLMTWT